MQTYGHVRYLGWHSLADLAKFRYGVVLISDHSGEFFAVDGRLNLKTELSLIRALAADGATTSRAIFHSERDDG